MTAGLAGLRRFLAPREAPPVEPAVERCELCAAQVAPEHPHLVDVAGRALKCACRPCALLFVDRTREMAGTAYRTVPDRYRYDPEFTLADAQWDALQIPVGMAFFLLNSLRDDAVVACYPSPAGATESELHFETWSRLVEMNPVLRELEPDAEALIVNRISDPPAFAIAPIDRCYMLVGLIKTSWEGISGGQKVEEAVASFFAELRGQAVAA